MLLLRRGGKITAPKIDGRLTANPKTKSLRFVGYLDTRGLEPGGYDLLAQAPGQGGSDKRRFLQRGFVIR